MPKKTYYNIKPLLSTGAQYMILLGQRANGKSYQCKLAALEDYVKNKKKFVYLRRWKQDIKTKSVDAYFGDMPVNKITGGEWDYVKAWNGDLYFAKVEDGIEKKSESIGRYCALNEYERYKSWVFKDYKYIIYEEFITDKIYLDGEPRLLQHFVSTVARHAPITVLMVGNTLSRVCPYFSEWCLEGVLRQKQGTIEIYHYHVDGGTIDVAVEYCATQHYENKMFFGQTAKQIITGEWDTVEVPGLPRKQYEYECIYKLLVKYQKFCFVLALMVEPINGGRICFIYPTEEDNSIERVITDKFSDLPAVTSVLDINKKPEYYIRECLRSNKVCYANNMTGADFKNVCGAFPFY